MAQSICLHVHFYCKLCFFSGKTLTRKLNFPELFVKLFCVVTLSRPRRRFPINAPDSTPNASQGCLSDRDSCTTFNIVPAKSYILIFHPLEVVSRYRDPQLPVGENYWHFFIIFKPNICKSRSLNTHFIPNNWLNLSMKQVEMIIIILSVQRVNRGLC